MKRFVPIILFLLLPAWAKAQIGIGMVHLNVSLQPGSVDTIHFSENAKNYIKSYSGSGASTFIGLFDTPSAFTGYGGYFLRVNSAENGLEFTPAPSGGGSASYLADLLDVNLSGLANDHVLMYSSANDWYNVSTALWDKDATNDLTTASSWSGDLSGTGLTPTVVGLRGYSITTASPSDGYVLKYNASTGKIEWSTDISSTGSTSLNNLTDVSLSSPASGEFLKYNGSAWTDASISTSDISDFSSTTSSWDKSSSDDITTSSSWSGDLSGVGLNPTVVKLRGYTLASTAPTDGYVLKYNSSTSQIEWSPDISGTGSSSLAELTDVSLTAPVNGQFLKYNGSNWVNSSITVSNISDFNSTTSSWDKNSSDDVTTSSSVGALADVSITSPTSSQVLQYDGSVWVNSPISTTEISDFNSATSSWDKNYSDDVTTSSSINALADVSLSSPASGQFFKFNGTNWINSSITTSNISDFSSTTSGWDKDASDDVTNLNGLTDVNLSTLYNNQIFKYDATTSKWINTFMQLNWIEGFDVQSPADNDILIYSLGQWVNSPLTVSKISDFNSTTSSWDKDASDDITTSSSINSLADVSVSSPSVDQILKYNGSNWVNAALSLSNQIQVTILNPDSITSDKICLFKNYKGSTVVIDSIKISTDDKNQNYWIELHESNENDTTSLNLIDQVVASSVGVGCYFKNETVLSHSSVENTHWIWLKPCKTIDVASIQVTVFYHY